MVGFVTYTPCFRRCMTSTQRDQTWGVLYLAISALGRSVLGVDAICARQEDSLASHAPPQACSRQRGSAYSIATGLLFPRSSPETQTLRTDRNCVRACNLAVRRCAGVVIVCAVLAVDRHRQATRVRVRRNSMSRVEVGERRTRRRLRQRRLRPRVAGDRARSDRRTRWRSGRSPGRTSNQRQELQRWRAGPRSRACARARDQPQARVYACRPDSLSVEIGGRLPVRGSADVEVVLLAVDCLAALPAEEDVACRLRDSLGRGRPARRGAGARTRCAKVGLEHRGLGLLRLQHERVLPSRPTSRNTQARVPTLPTPTTWPCRRSGRSRKR